LLTVSNTERVYITSTTEMFIEGVMNKVSNLENLSFVLFVICLFVCLFEIF
jgi:hypothetical protein